MARYIDADKLIEELNSNSAETWAKGLGRGWWSHSVMLKDNIVYQIKHQPTADVEKVRHGEWELKSEIRQLFDDIDEKFYVECPICHRVEYVPFELTEEKMLEYAKEHYPYCHCGARMDGGEKE